MNSKEASLGRTSAVGLFGAGENQLCDMSGNTWEWTSSHWGGNFGQCAFPYGDNYEQQELSQGDVEPVEYRILRGGSWFDSSDGCRCAVRNGDPPYDRNLNTGFRVVCVGAE